MKLDSLSHVFRNPKIMRLGILAGFSLFTAQYSHGQQDADVPPVVHLEQNVNAVLEEAGNDTAAIQAALGKLMRETRPTAAGLKAIASAAMRKVATYNQHSILNAVSEGIVKAALRQAKGSQLDPIKSCAAVAEGLVGSAMGTTSRRGGNSIATATVVAQATLHAVVRTAAALKIPVDQATNAAAFGATTAAMVTSVDYGHDLVATSINVTSGIAEGAIRGAQEAGVDASTVGNAALTGTIDSIHVVSAAAKVPAGPIVEGARAGYQRGLEVAMGRGVNTLADEEDPNRDILGTMVPPKTVLRQDPQTKLIEVHVESSQPLPDNVAYILYKNGEQIAQNTQSPEFSLPTTQPTEQTVGVYSIQLVDLATNQTLAALPTTFTLQTTVQLGESPAD